MAAGAFLTTFLAFLAGAAFLATFLTHFLAQTFLTGADFLATARAKH